MTPPYASDTRAKGWRFELDYERIRQSDTWALALPEHRPWLLMLWMVAWEQTPCGSLPDDDALIAARIGMAPKAFAKARDTLRRGWWLAEDGRLYHQAITQHVLRMVDKRAKEATRKAGNRQGTPPSVPRDNTGTDATGTETGTSTGTVKAKKASAVPSLTIEELQAEGLSQETAAEFLALRQRKGSKLTPRAWAGIRTEIVKARWAPEQAIVKCLARGWTGFEAEWVKDDRTKRAELASATTPPSETVEENRKRLDEQNSMTPEQWEASRKAKAMAMSALKNITPGRVAA